VLKQHAQKDQPKVMVIRLVNCAVRSSSRCIGHFRVRPLNFRDRMSRKAFPCRKRIFREPSPRHEPNRIRRRIPLNLTRLG